MVKVEPFVSLFWVIHSLLNLMVDFEGVEYVTQEFKPATFTSHTFLCYLVDLSCTGLKILEAPCGSSSVLMLLRTVEHFSIKHFISDS